MFAGGNAYLVPEVLVCQAQYLQVIFQVAALMTAVHWVVHGGARDALEYQVREKRCHRVNCLSY